MSADREREGSKGGGADEGSADAAAAAAAEAEAQATTERADQTQPTGGPDLPERLAAKTEPSEAAEAEPAEGAPPKKSPFENAFEATASSAEPASATASEPASAPEPASEPASETASEPESESETETETETASASETETKSASESASESESDAEIDSTEGASPLRTSPTAARGALASLDPARPTPAPEPTIDAVYFGRTDVGLIREHNEDNFTIVDIAAGTRGSAEDEVRETVVGERGVVFAVCDGMGGAAAGEVASQMAVDTIYEFFTTMGVPKSRDHFALRVVSAIEEAGNRIFSAAKMDRTRRGMGTTATVAGLMDKVLFVGQVGDSRAYILRNGNLVQITKDQSLVNQLIEAGQLTEEEAEAFEHSNIILQALGTTEEVSVDLTFLELRRGDRLMMCSDGLSGLVHPEMIKDVLSTEKSLVECAKKLIDMANAGGGHDNITCVCVDFAGEGLAPPKPDENAAYQQYPLPPGLSEERESLPPRDMRIKEGGPKPGADVKRSHDEDEDDVVPARPVEQPSRIPIVLVAIAVLVIVVAVVLAMRGSDDAPEETPVPSGAIEPVEGETQPEDELLEGEVEVRVVTDIEGELFVDGESQGPLDAQEDVVLFLVPGAYRFQAKSGDSVVAEELVTVTGGTPMSVSLTMPTGTTGTAPPEETQVVEESGGTTGGATPEPEPVPAPEAVPEAPAPTPNAPQNP